MTSPDAGLAGGVASWVGVAGSLADGEGAPGLGVGDDVGIGVAGLGGDAVAEADAAGATVTGGPVPATPPLQAATMTSAMAATTTMGLERVCESVVIGPSVRPAGPRTKARKS
jgi:hypothetical protein